MGAFRQASACLAAGMLGLGLLALPACTSYTNVPGPESKPAQQDPNARQPSSAMEAALRWAIRRHPVPGPYALNLPVGTTRETADRIAAALGPDAVVPDSTETDLPVYHVTRVWIRLSDAKVDVVYPMTDGLGRKIQRGVTVWMHAGVRPWTVSRGQYWSPGTIPVPPVWVPPSAADLAAQHLPDEPAETPDQPGDAPTDQPADKATDQATDQAADQAGGN